ncbi:HET-domain-containing protein [Mycena venus]|uniref:HET-domain-containing protein n=1 Tax=Mycena venus TaxID=2733690 RepID=A0A8H6XYX9_9AGAR|nr:HET-domain-containing protein [Mycena venus]
MFVGGSNSGMAVSAASIPVDSTSLLELPASAVSERVSDASTACIEGSQSPSIDTTTRPLDVEPEKERWRCVSRNWYGKAIADQLNHGRLHHHLGLRILTIISRLLKEASSFVSDYEGLGRIHRGAARNQLGDTFSEFQKKIEFFGTRFRTNRLVDLAVQQNIIHQTVEKVYDMATGKRLEEWLQPPDMGQKQHDTQKLRKEGTGSWFLEGRMFIEWQDSPGSLWIQGPSGSGKTVLSSAVIRKLFDDQQLSEDLGKSCAVAFFYFDFKTKEGQTVETALRRIVLQLSAQSPYRYRALDKHYNLSKGQTLPSYHDLRSVLEELLGELQRTYILLDALDECQDSEIEQLMDLISMLRGWSWTPLPLLITSQHRKSFTEEFKDLPCVFLESRLIENDIKSFIAGEISGNRRMKVWASRANEIVDRIALKCNGMFRLAACLLVELSRCTRQNQLDETLKNMPTDLFGIYDRFLERGQPRDLVYVTGVLRWLIFSTATLNLTQLADAIAFDFTSKPPYTYDPAQRPDNVTVNEEWLEGLATVREDKEQKRLVLAHASVQDYLLTRRFADKFGYDLSANHSHAWVARGCIGYLMHFADHPLSKETLPEYPLAVYAAKYWCYHLLRSNDQPALTSEALDLLQRGSKQYIAMNDLRNTSDLHSISFGTPLKPPIHLCLDENYSNDGIRMLLQNSTGDNIQSEKDSALRIACSRKQAYAARLLLENGANPNAQGADGGALQAAIRLHEIDIARLLFEHGADANSACGGAFAEWFQSSLQAAAWMGSTHITHLLIDKGADINAQGGIYGTALQTAFCEGHEDIIQLLLANGADANSPCKGAFGDWFGSFLQAAACMGYSKIARLFLESGADVNAQGGRYGCALQAACSGGHTEIVELLLTHGADPNPVCQGIVQYWFGSLLQAVAWRGYTEIALLLLKNGADVNARGGRYGSALQAACFGLRTDTVQLLLENGADADAQGIYFETALQVASWAAQEDIVHVLLANGVDLNAEEGKWGGALQAAAWHSDISIARLLIQNGADVHVQSRKYGSALQAACSRAHTELVSLLGLLQAASWRGYTKIARLLLTYGADVNAHGGKYGSALAAASWNGHTETVLLLLESGADINAQSGDLYSSALQAALRNGHIGTVFILVENGADANAADAAEITRQQEDTDRKHAGLARRWAELRRIEVETWQSEKEIAIRKQSAQQEEIPRNHEEATAKTFALEAQMAYLRIREEELRRREEIILQRMGAIQQSLVKNGAELQVSSQKLREINEQEPELRRLGAEINRRAEEVSWRKSLAAGKKQSGS